MWFELYLTFSYEFNSQIPFHDLFEINGVSFSVQTPEVSHEPRDQSLDKFDKFWIDLNEATAMRPEAKAQIYSVNENLPANQVARMWGILDQLERAREKEKKWRSRRWDSKLQVE